jgi:membrane fusion protein
VPSAAYRPGDFIAPIPFEEPVYRVVVDPARRTVEGYGERRDLVSGMTLTADVVIERRTFLDAILDPLRAARLRTEL